LSVSNIGNNGNVVVSAINSMTVIDAAGDHKFKSFNDDISRKLYSTIDDAQTELMLPRKKSDLESFNRDQGQGGVRN
jgi:hypothetical protein